MIALACLIKMIYYYHVYRHDYANLSHRDDGRLFSGSLRHCDGGYDCDRPLDFGHDVAIVIVLVA